MGTIMSGDNPGWQQMQNDWVTQIMNTQATIVSIQIQEITKALTRIADALEGKKDAS